MAHVSMASNFFLYIYKYGIDTKLCNHVHGYGGSLIASYIYSRTCNKYDIKEKALFFIMMKKINNNNKKLFLK